MYYGSYALRAVDALHRYRQKKWRPRYIYSTYKYFIGVLMSGIIPVDIPHTIGDPRARN